MAAAVCERRGEKFTDLRRGVLKVLLEAGSPLRAYDVVPLISAALGRAISAMTVYRSLEFLMAQDLVARLKSHNAFIARSHPDSPHICILYVCEKCGTSVEREKAELGTAVASDTVALGFSARSHILEMRGLCAQCGNTACSRPSRGPGAGDRVQDYGVTGIDRRRRGG